MPEPKVSENAVYLVQESPEYVRTSLAASITLRFIEGSFFRNAKLYCLNFLLTYNEGCIGRCAYCGLSRSRGSDKKWSENSFIRVDWITLKLEDIIHQIDAEFGPHIKRICISMVTHKRAPADTLHLVKRFHQKTDSISVLIAPTMIDHTWLLKIKEAGADKMDIAFDATTPELFEKMKGREVLGPHKWETYWRTLEDAVNIFGRYNAGIHLIVGLEETEKEITKTIQTAYDAGSFTRLFSFFPEEGSLLQHHQQPPIGSYRRIQLARYLINKNLTTFDKMGFNGKIADFGVEKEKLRARVKLADIVDSGLPFITSGCSKNKSENVCNRPFSDFTPSQAYYGEMRNFPFTPQTKDIPIIRKQLEDYSDTPVAEWIDCVDCFACSSMF